MPTLHVTYNTLRVHLTRAEKIAGVLHDLELPVTAIRSVDVLSDGCGLPWGSERPGSALLASGRSAPGAGRDARQW